MKESNIDSYIKRNRSSFVERDLTKLLAEFYDRRRMTKADLARRSGMSEVYLHQLFAGRRCPSRDKLLCFCIGLELNVDDAQRILREASYVQLYPRICREAVIYHGLAHKHTLLEINDALMRAGEKRLG